MPLFGPPDIAKLKAKGDVAELIKALNYPKDPAICRAAITALGELRSSQAVAPLANLLRTGNKDLHQDAIAALGKIGDTAAIACLVSIVKQLDNRQMQEKAINALSGKKDPQIIAAFTEMLLPQYPFHVRKSAIEALGKAGASEAIGQLVILLGDESGLCASTAYALAQIGDRQAIAPLLAALNLHWQAILRGAIQFDNCIGIVKSLQQLGWSPEANESGALFYAFNRQWQECASLGGAAVVPLCVAVICAKDFDAPFDVNRIKDALLQASNNLDQEEVRTQATRWLTDHGLTHWNEDIRRIAAELLPQIAGEQTTAPLLANFTRANRDELNNNMLAEMALALQKLDSNIALKLTTNLDQQQNMSQTIIALGILRAPNAVEKLVQILQNNDIELRRDAVIALGQIGDPRGAPALVACLQDKSLGFTSALALGDIGDRQAIPALENALQDEAVADAAVASLFKLGAEPDENRVVNILKKLCHGYTWNDQALVRRLEPVATRIGQELDRRGGIGEMRRVFALLNGMDGSRTLEMHWNGIGTWRG